MPQVCRPSRLGVALDHDMTKTPMPVYNDMKRSNSRAYRASIPDHSNMLLNERRNDNVLDEKHWQGKGFPGHFQFIPYLGRERIRPGVKVERDLQVSTTPFENSKPLNTTMMGRAQVQLASQPSEDERRAHEEAMSSIRSMQRYGEGHERAENPHAHARNELALSMKRQERLATLQSSVEGLRTAGLASVNPRMGTNGSLPDLMQLRGKAGMDQWRSSTPWSLDGSCNAPSAWPQAPVFAQPN